VNRSLVSSTVAKPGDHFSEVVSSVVAESGGHSVVNITVSASVFASNATVKHTPSTDCADSIIITDEMRVQSE